MWNTKFLFIKRNFIHFSFSLFVPFCPKEFCKINIWLYKMSVCFIPIYHKPSWSCGKFLSEAHISKPVIQRSRDQIPLQTIMIFWGTNWYLNSPSVWKGKQESIFQGHLVISRLNTGLKGQTGRLFLGRFFMSHFSTRTIG